MGDEALHDLTPAYALDALDEAERREYETHLAHCDQCRRELASLSDAATSLAYAVDAPPPPPDLRSRILTAARNERPNVVPLRPRWAVPAAVAAAVAVAASVALAFWAVSARNKLDNERAARAKDQRVATILASADARAFSIHGRGRLVVTGDGDAALVLTTLRPAPSGKTYEAWVAVGGGSPQPAGTFDAGSGLTAVSLAKRVPRGATVMVTREHAGGTDSPTTKPFITVNTAS